MFLFPFCFVIISPTFDYHIFLYLLKKLGELLTRIMKNQHIITTEKYLDLNIENRGSVFKHNFLGDSSGQGIDVAFHCDGTGPLS